MASFFRALAEIHRSKSSDNPLIKIALVTSRNFNLMGRPIDTLRGWGIQLDKAYAIGPMSKRRVLEHLHPLMFFDDNANHCADAAICAPTAHVIALSLPSMINGNGQAPAQAPLLSVKSEPKNNFLLICRSYLNLKNGSGDTAALEQWFDQRVAGSKMTAIEGFMAELEDSIKSTPVGDERPAKGAKNEKSAKLIDFLDKLARKHLT